MLRTLDSLNGYSITATDDELGKVKDVYFDDERWGLRYLIVDTGAWLSTKKVLVSPYSITHIDDVEETILVSLTRDQVEKSPEIDTRKPVSRQFETEYSRYYGMPDYWVGPHLWGLGGMPQLRPTGGADRVSEQTSTAVGGLPDEPPERVAAEPEDVHLHSNEDVDGYRIVGTDDDIGHVEDFVFDDQDWAIRYLIVDTRNWWPGGKKVLIATQWVEHISWSESSVQIKLTREQIRNSPEYDEDLPLERDYESRLHAHYGMTGYWE